MIQKIQGEQPFQVLATNFSISPSNEGYTLQVSADGENYSNLFSVGAGISRMVTGVANGSYYRLQGNQSEVSINWRTQCSDGGSGGGGSYTLPVASQSTLGGVKIGEGITIDSEGTISAQGGGDALIHLDSLEGVTGETNMIYECDGELFWWNPSSGYVGEWTNNPDFGIITDATAFGFRFSTVPDGFVFAEIQFSTNQERVKIIKEGSNIVARKKSDDSIIASGATGENISFTPLGGSSLVPVHLILKPHYLGLYTFAVSNRVYNSNNGYSENGHWELVCRENEPYLGPNPITNSLPNFDRNGKILSLPIKNIHTTSIYLNSDNKYVRVLRDTIVGNPITRIFAPTSGGTAGQVLVSSGVNAEPQWINHIKSVQITSAAYEALATKDTNTLYLIVD